MLTTSRLLEDQLEFEIGPYLKVRKFRVCHFSALVREEKDLIVIVDKADEYVAKNAVVFKDDGSLGGLPSL